MDKRKIDYKYERLEQALKRFKEAINEYETLDSIIAPSHEHHEAISLGLRDSIIKRFEFSVECFWKYLKLNLEVTQGSETGGPKNVMRICLSVNFTTPEQTELLLEMLEYRNQTSHIYKEEVAELIAQKAEDHHRIMSEVLKQVQKISVR